ncbi:MAG: hypothetical protein JWM34_4368 [Ilumatobacteraceae bacterium]|nr:hypothetical protein [Ilumatobacteraceae bacterium]
MPSPDHDRAAEKAGETVGSKVSDRVSVILHEGEHPAKAIDDLLLDRIDALQVLRANTPEEKGKILEAIGGRGKAEQEIVDEMSKQRPLWRPDRFEEAHRLAMRSLEVLDRNGARTATMPRIGPLKPVAQWLVQLITQWIVKNHQNSVITKIRKLYERREANAIWGSDEHHMLRRARINAVQVEKGFKANTLGLPTFLVGGAFLTSILSGAQTLARSALSSSVGTVVFGAILAGVLAAVAWAALFGAAVSRRRIRLSTDQPLKALWETIGACGNPPRDASYDFALYAIILTALAWIIIPFMIYFFFHNLATDVRDVHQVTPTTLAHGARLLLAGKNAV